MTKYLFAIMVCLGACTDGYDVELLPPQPADDDDAGVGVEGRAEALLLQDIADDNAGLISHDPIPADREPYCPVGESASAAGDIGVATSALHAYAPSCFTHNGVVSPVGQSMRTLSTMLVSYVLDDVNFYNAHTSGQINGADVTYPLGANQLARPVFLARNDFKRSACYSNNGTQVVTWIVYGCYFDATKCLNAAQASTANAPPGYIPVARAEHAVWCKTDYVLPGTFTRVKNSAVDQSTTKTLQTMVHPGCTGGLPNACNYDPWNDSCPCGTPSTPDCR